MVMLTSENKSSGLPFQLFSASIILSFSRTSQNLPCSLQMLDAPNNINSGFLQRSNKKKEEKKNWDIRPVNTKMFLVIHSLNNAIIIIFYCDI